MNESLMHDVIVGIGMILIFIATVIMLLTGLIQ
jgi:hypothetical protein